MLVGIQMYVTFDLDFDTIADALGISKDEVERLWEEEELKEKLDDKMNVSELLKLCGDLDSYGGVTVGNAYC